MLKGHPKGLYVAFFANMGERFGFYTMMAILVLFLQAKFGLAAETAGDIYSWFYFAIYALSLLGGILADATKKYTAVIAMGQVVMFLGYALLVVPGLSLPITVVGLAVTVAVDPGALTIPNNAVSVVAQNSVIALQPGVLNLSGSIDEVHNGVSYLSPGGLTLTGNAITVVVGS